MFMAGIAQGETIALIVIEKILKNLKKHYVVQSLKQFPSDADSAEIENEIIAVYHKPDFTLSRRVFSQDRRPAKRVKIPPLIVTAFTGTDTGRPDRLRKRKIPAEGISLCKENIWRKEDYGPICLGNNYYVPEHEPLLMLRAVWQEHRLIIGENVPGAENLVREIGDICTDSMPHSDSSRSRKNFIPALSLPVWFSEKIRVIRRY